VNYLDGNRRFQFNLTAQFESASPFAYIRRDSLVAEKLSVAGESGDLNMKAERDSFRAATLGGMLF
jgi:hypothetical protein